MDILDKEILDNIKKEYNHNLLRYYKGCNYCQEHQNEIDMWTPKLLEILNNMDLIMQDIMRYTEVSDMEILMGFKI